MIDIELMVFNIGDGVRNDKRILLKIKSNVFIPYFSSTISFFQLFFLFSIFLYLKPSRYRPGVAQRVPGS